MNMAGDKKENQSTPPQKPVKDRPKVKPSEPKTDTREKSPSPKDVRRGGDEQKER